MFMSLWKVGDDCFIDGQGAVQYIAKMFYPMIQDLVFKCQ